MQNQNQIISESYHLIIKRKNYIHFSFYEYKYLQIHIYIYTIINYI